jgi:hypothetical protein
MTNCQRRIDMEKVNGIGKLWQPESRDTLK